MKAKRLTAAILAGIALLTVTKEKGNTNDNNKEGIGSECKGT